MEQLIMARTEKLRQENLATGKMYMNFFLVEYGWILLMFMY